MKNTTNKSKFQTKVVKSSFTGTNITKFSGLSPIMKFFGKLKIGKQINTTFATKMYNATKFTNVQIFLTVILASLGGIKRISRISNFSGDGLLKALLGLKKQINGNAISKCFKILGEKGAHLLQDFCFEHIRSFIKKTAITFLTIDCDSTVFTVYGNQEGAAKGYNPHKKGAKSYHPLIAFGSELKLVINNWFRTGSAYTSNGICEFMKQTVAVLPEGIKLFFRADSGFFDGELFDLLEKLGISYLVKVKLKNLAKLLEQQTWTVTSENKDIAICEFDHKAIGWSKSRKLRAVRSVKEWHIVEYLGQIEKVAEYEYACFCSDLPGTATELYKKYSERSTCETWIEQVKSQLMAGKTLTDNFWANDMLWQLNIFAYNLSIMMRFKITKFWRQEHTTFKEWFIEVPAKLVQTGHQLILRIYQNYYEKEQWLKLERLLI